LLAGSCFTSKSFFDAFVDSSENEHVRAKAGNECDKNPCDCHFFTPK
jgi:hypothetical protein